MTCSMTFCQDMEGWDYAGCACGWTSPPCPGIEEASGFWQDHVQEVRHA